MRHLYSLEEESEPSKHLNEPLISLVRTCQHLEPTEKTVGHKKKFKILWCKNCGLVLDMKEMK